MVRMASGLSIRAYLEWVGDGALGMQDDGLGHGHGERVAEGKTSNRGAKMSDIAIYALHIRNNKTKQYQMRRSCTYASFVESLLMPINN